MERGIFFDSSISDLLTAYFDVTKPVDKYLAK